VPDAHLATIIAGEAGMCGISAMLAVAWLYSRNPIMYGSAPPTPSATWIASNWQMMADPVPGSIAMFSAHDLELLRVKQLIAKMDLRPLREFDCGNGFALVFYGQ
jgi:hypothetical protein